MAPRKLCGPLRPARGVKMLRGYFTPSIARIEDAVATYGSSALSLCFSSRLVSTQSASSSSAAVRRNPNICSLWLIWSARLRGIPAGHGTLVHTVTVCGRRNHVTSHFFLPFSSVSNLGSQLAGTWYTCIQIFWLLYSVITGYQTGISTHLYL